MQEAVLKRLHCRFGVGQTEELFLLNLLEPCHQRLSVITDSLFDPLLPAAIMGIGMHYHGPVGSSIESDVLLLKTITGADILAAYNPMVEPPRFLPGIGGKSLTYELSACAKVFRQPGDETDTVMHESEVLLGGQSGICNIDEILN